MPILLSICAEVASVVVQLRVAVCPLAMFAGLTTKLTVGAAVVPPDVPGAAAIGPLQAREKTTGTRRNTQSTRFMDRPIKITFL